MPPASTSPNERRRAWEQVVGLVVANMTRRLLCESLRSLPFGEAEQPLPTRGEDFHNRGAMQLCGQPQRPKENEKLAEDGRRARSALGNSAAPACCARYNVPLPSQ